MKWELVAGDCINLEYVESISIRVAGRGEKATIMFTSGKGLEYGLPDNVQEVRSLMFALLKGDSDAAN